MPKWVREDAPTDPMQQDSVILTTSIVPGPLVSETPAPAEPYMPYPLSSRVGLPSGLGADGDVISMDRGYMAWAAQANLSGVIGVQPSGLAWPAGAAGDMLVSDGTDWKLLEAGDEHQQLVIDGATPTWVNNWSYILDPPVLGDLIVGSGTGTWGVVHVGDAGKVLTVVGGTAAWAAAPATMVYPGAGIPVSTGSAWGSSITNNSTNWNTAYGWGNHANAGYLVGSAADLTVTSPLAATVTTGVVLAATTLSISGSNLTSATTGVHVTGTGAVLVAASFTIDTASAGGPGLLSAANWSTFNGKTNPHALLNNSAHTDTTASAVVPGALIYGYDDTTDTWKASAAAASNGQLPGWDQTNKNVTWTPAPTVKGQFYQWIPAVGEVAATWELLDASTGLAAGQILYASAGLKWAVSSTPPPEGETGPDSIPWFDSGTQTMGWASANSPGQFLYWNTGWSIGPSAYPTGNCQVLFWSQSGSTYYVSDASTDNTGVLTSHAYSAAGVKWVNGGTEGQYLRCVGASPNTVVGWADGASGMVYPGAGIAVSTGSAWSSSITDNSADWNTAYGWGDHAGEGYLVGSAAALTLPATLTATVPANLATALVTAVTLQVAEGYEIPATAQVPAAAGAVGQMLVSNGTNWVAVAAPETFPCILTQTAAGTFSWVTSGAAYKVFAGNSDNSAVVSDWVRSH